MKIKKICKNLVLFYFSKTLMLFSFNSEKKPQIFGVISTRSESVQFMTNNEFSNIYTKIDLNNQKLLCRHYNGQLLKPFSILSFPTDQSLISYTASVLTNISKLAILVSNSSKEKVITDFKLSSDDQLILENFLIEMNFEKYGKLLKSHNESTPKLYCYTL